MNFVNRIAEAATRFPGQVAIERIGPDGAAQATTYADLLADAGRWSLWLTARGVACGDRVALLGDNDACWIACYLGILGIGAVAVPLDTAYRLAQIATVLSHCSARIVCAGEKYAEAAIGAGEATSGAGGSGRPEFMPLTPRAGGDPAPAPPIADMADVDPAVMLYTSGTTADPKGVVLTHANLDAERTAALSVVDCRDTDAVLGVLPLFHALAQMANLLVPLSTGARVVFLETVSSSSLLTALQQREISIFVCVPQFFYLIHQRVMAEIARASRLRRLLFRALLKMSGWCRARFGWNPGRRWFGRVHRALGPRMRILVTGGSRFDPAIGRDLYDMGFTLLNGYGLTETTGAATAQRPGDVFTTSVGQPLAGVEVRIADEEILIRGPIVMRGYFNRPDATAEALRDGWLHTGDLGSIDAAGRLYITGRRKEIIVLSSGKNLYPEEIEAHYQKSPFVKELCVLGLTRPGEPSAERLHAVIVPDEQAMRARGAVNVRELLRFELEGLAVQLPAHKRILSYDISLTPLARTTIGKLRRHEIERWVHEHGASASRADAPAPALSADEDTWLAGSGRPAAIQAIAAMLKRDAIRPDANLELDLGLDSMERVELLTTMEQRARATVATPVRATIFSVRDLVEAIERATPRAEGGPARGEPAWDTILSTRPDPAILTRLDRGRLFRATVFFLFIRAVRTGARLLFGFRVRGVAQVPQDGAAIITPNHQSFFDGFIVASALPFRALQRIFFVGAAEYYQTPWSRWLARLANIVPVDPDANLVAAMQVSAAGLRSGRVLVLFPEGERTIDGEVKTFRKGAAILASHLQVPIVPAAIEGPFAIWPRSRPFAWSRIVPGRTPRVSLRFGEPLRPRPGAYAEDTAALQRQVERMVQESRDERPRLASEGRTPGG